MTPNTKPPVVAVGSDKAFRLARGALGDAVQLIRVNVRRLTREYGEEVAGEVLRQVVIGRLRPSQARAARRRSR